MSIWRPAKTVHAELDTDAYSLGVEISDQQMADVSITRHGFHGDWNYTLHLESRSPAVDTGPLPATEWDTTTLSDPRSHRQAPPELDTVTTALDALRQAHTDARHCDSPPDRA